MVICEEEALSYNVKQTQYFLPGAWGPTAITPLSKT